MRGSFAAKDCRAPLGYEFTVNGYAEGWTLSQLTDNNGGPLGGLWVTTAPGSDPKVISPVFRRCASALGSIVVRMANNGNPAASSTLQVFWQTDSEPFFCESKSVKKPVGNGGGWQSITFNVGQHAKWSGVVTRLRVDPIEAGNGHDVGLDYVRLK